MRLADLQVLRHESLVDIANEKMKKEYLLEPRRGDILDIKGNLLATSVFVKTVCADPVLIGTNQQEVARTIAPLLQLTESQLAQMLMVHVRTNGVTNRYVVLRRKVPTEVWQQVSTAMRTLDFGVDEKTLLDAERTFYKQLRTSAVFVDPVDDQQRVYPSQKLASHVLGYVGMSEVEVNGRTILQTSGKEGIELSLDSKLTGVRGWRITGRDRRGREVVRQREQDVQPLDGLNVVLTIDSVVQHIVEDELAKAAEKHTPASITGVVIRPRTGEVVAMATLPDFDPNRPGNFPPDSRRNRVIADVVEPGSTFKMVVVSAALSEGIVRLTDVFDTENGRFPYAGRILHDDHAYSSLTTEGIVTKSSNIGAAKIGIKLGDDRLHDYIRDFGFGVRTAIPLRGEVPGILHPVKNWSKVSIVQIPMGHGVAVTRMQMAMAMAAIANNGLLMRPMLVNRLEDQQGRVVAQYSPQRVRQVITPEAARAMVRALKTVVTPEGTGVRATLNHYTAAGKTGTAQKVENGTYVHGKYISSFIGFFPADNPELCIAVTLDNPRNGHYGGTVAGPVFKAIAERSANYLSIPPDKLPEIEENLRQGREIARTAAAPKRD